MNPLNILIDSYTYFNNDNTFIIFKSINNLFYLIYSTENISIICYDLNNQRKIIEVKNCHKENINSFRHYSDIINKRDLILSTSLKDNNLKIWNINSFECILNISRVNSSGYLKSSCFLNINNIIYIITSSFHLIEYIDNEPIKIYNLKGIKIDEINKSKDKTNFIDTYYDKKMSKIFIITGNYGFSKSYNYEKNEVYNEYSEYRKISFKTSNNIFNIYSLFILDTEKIVKLIESCEDGNIRIWNFHNSILLNKIETNNDILYGICLWNNNYIFVATDEDIKGINIKNKKIENNLIGHNEIVLTVKKINDTKYGEMLISQDLNGHIIIWVKEKNN